MPIAGDQQQHLPARPRRGRRGTRREGQRPLRGPARYAPWNLRRTHPDRPSRSVVLPDGVDPVRIATAMNPGDVILDRADAPHQLHRGPARPCPRRRRQRRSDGDPDREVPCSLVELFDVCIAGLMPTTEEPVAGGRGLAPALTYCCSASATALTVDHVPSPSHRARERSRMGCGPTATPRPVRRVGFPTAGARTGSAASAGRYGGDAVVFGKPV